MGGCEVNVRHRDFWIDANRRAGVGLAIGLALAFGTLAARGDDAGRETSGKPGIDLAVMMELDLGQPIRQCRAVPVSLGADEPPGVAALYGSDAEIDPYIGMFFFPKSTLKLVVFDVTGVVRWKRDLGPGVVPGVWFSPIYATDIDRDGVDELYIVNNLDPEHPLDHRRYVLEQLGAADGKVMAQRPWPQPLGADSMSHTYRHNIVGGEVGGETVVVAVAGTYGKHALVAYGSGLEKKWESTIDPAKSGGALGCHLMPVVDIDQDGDDEVFIGERCISLRDGREQFCCDRDTWKGHSDIVLPVYRASDRRWTIWTCRESFEDVGPRVAMFDDHGEAIWRGLDRGHMDSGWAARLGPNGEPLVFTIRVGKKSRSAAGEHRVEVEEFVYEPFTGAPRPLGFNVYTTIPVDLNGDGVHELVKGFFEGDGTVLDRAGRVLGSTGGLSAIHSHFTGKPGEQILSYHPDGKLRIWHDRNANDTPEALDRYRSRAYRANQKMSGVGYNLFNLGGI
jgi:hypothetical protein